MDFEKLADEALADVERGTLTLRDAVIGHGRVMFEEGVRAAHSFVENSISDCVDTVLHEAGGEG